MAQTGDPTNTGRGGSSVFDSGRPFKDEFHSRLRFNTRGRVAMANEGRKDSNGSQWFVTLGECEWLNRKHTIFGKVVGATMYNAIQIGNVETENDRPVAPAPKIVKTEVLANPFPDIEPRKPTNVEEEEVVEDFRKKKKAKKKLNLLSFGEEAAEEEATLDEVGIKGIKSSHDVGGDATLVSADAEETRAALEQTAREKAMAKEKKARVKERMQDMGADVSDDDADEGKDRGKSGWDDAAGADDAAAFQDQMRDKMLRKRRELGDVDGGLKEIEEDIRKQSDALASKLDKREMKAKRKAEKEAREAERVHRRATKLKKLGLGKCAVRDADAALMTSDEVKRVEAKRDALACTTAKRTRLRVWRRFRPNNPLRRNPIPNPIETTTKTTTRRRSVAWASRDSSLRAYTTWKTTRTRTTRAIGRRTNWPSSLNRRETTKAHTSPTSTITSSSTRSSRRARVNSPTRGANRQPNAE